MSTLTHGKIMHLIDQNDYDLLQRYKRESQNDGVVAESDEIRAKQFKEQFLQDKNEEKFKEDYEWEKLGKRLDPILHPPDSTVKDKSNEEIINTVRESLSGQFKNKGKLFLKRLLHEDKVSIDNKYIYLDKVPLKHDIIDVVAATEEKI